MAKRKKHTSAYWGSFVLGWFKYLQDTDLNSTSYRVLFTLCEKMSFDKNVAFVKQKEIASELNMDPGNISKAIRLLKEKQFIAKCSNGFMVNPHLFYVGMSHPADREELRCGFDELVLENEEKLRFSLNEDEHKLELIDQKEG